MREFRQKSRRLANWRPRSRGKRQSCSCDTAPRSSCSQPPPIIGRNRPRRFKKRVPRKCSRCRCRFGDFTQSQIANHACDCGGGGGYVGGSLDLYAMLQRQRMPIICLTPAAQFSRTQLEILYQWHRRTRAITRHSHTILNWTLSVQAILIRYVAGNFRSNEILSRMWQRLSGWWRCFLTSKLFALQLQTLDVWRFGSFARSRDFT